MTLTIADRGGADLWPENTVAAFAGAIACGADGAELDVHLSRDGQVVVFHDEALKPEIVRDRDGQWLPATGPLLKDLTFAELRAYDIGRLKPGTGYARRHPAQTPFDGERIPLLADVIARTIVAPADVPVGIVTATLGAPVFLWLLLRMVPGDAA